MKVPFLRPRPVRLATLAQAMTEIDGSGVFSNFGPVNQRFERDSLRALFAASGGCLTVGNATLGLILAIRDAIGDIAGRRRFALMPSFTFAATAQAALWNGLTPLLCDMDADAWTPCPDSEDRLIEQYGDEIAVIVPYATFANGLDLERYRTLAERHGIPLVIDAAASLGSTDHAGRQFGSGFAHPVVFSMHATKPFATMEGGLIYCSDTATISRLKAMSNFGFGEARVATMPGLNAKLSEIHALLALAKLGEIDEVVTRRCATFEHYRARLDGWTFQTRIGDRQAHTFVPVLLPVSQVGRREAIVRQLAEEGVGAATYFSPHLAEHPYFTPRCVADRLNVTDAVASRVVCLPLYDDMLESEVDFVCDKLVEACSLVPGMSS